MRSKLDRMIDYADMIEALPKDDGFVERGWPDCKSLEWQFARNRLLQARNRLENAFDAAESEALKFAAVYAKHVIKE